MRRCAGWTQAWRASFILRAACCVLRAACSVLSAQCCGSWRSASACRAFSRAPDSQQGAGRQ
ncbi:hypothetical protein C1H21_17240 [Xanthomonas arboricola pv. juglandis]|nr:hypothetical protein C1H21_17240 [Xanthomonas arboricola pv. juglandis]